MSLSSLVFCVGRRSGGGGGGCAGAGGGVAAVPASAQNPSWCVSRIYFNRQKYVINPKV